MQEASADPTADHSRSRRFAFRWGPSAVGLLAFGTMVALHESEYRATYFALLQWWGVPAYPYPFVDTFSILRAIDCWRLGVDVFVPNACMEGGWYSYSPLLLWSAGFPIGVDQRLPFGLLLDVVFLLAFSMLPRCRSWWELAVRSLAILSTSTFFALERANFDIAVFLIALGGLILLRGRLWTRLLGYGAFALAALLKFYPAVLLLLVARERRRVAASIGLAVALLGAAVIVHTIGDTAKAVQLAPAGSPIRGMFGARNLPMGIGWLVSPPGDVTGDVLVRAPLPAAGHAVAAILLLLSAGAGWRAFRIDRERWRVLESSEASFLVAGALLIGGCFFAGQNVAYRAIFLVLLLPGLFTLHTDGTRHQQHYRRLLIAVLFLMWEEFFHHLVGALQILAASRIGEGTLEVPFWLARELVWWWVVARLWSLVGAFLFSTPLACAWRGITLPPRP